MTCIKQAKDIDALAYINDKTKGNKNGKNTIRRT